MNEQPSKILNKLSIFQHIPTGVFLIAFIITGSFSIYSLRSNNQEMIKLRVAVYEADKNAGDTEGALANLRSYVHSHMNTDLSSGGNSIKPPIQLKYAYERLQATELERINQTNAKVYTEAQAFCESQNQAFSGRSRVPCIEEYVTTHGEKAKVVQPALYQFDFVSSNWSFDRAGWSLILTGILLMLLLLSFMTDKLMKPESEDY